MLNGHWLVVICVVIGTLDDVTWAGSLPDERNESAVKQQELGHRGGSWSPGLSFLKEQVELGDDLLKGKLNDFYVSRCFLSFSPFTIIFIFLSIAWLHLEHCFAVLVIEVSSSSQARTAV
jgi:hypothetical protein